MRGSRGVFLMIWGKKEYGYAAKNFAISLKHHSPLLPIHLYSDEIALKGIGNCQGLFDNIQLMGATPLDPALEKMQVYDKLPFEHNLFLDVDSLCTGDLTPLMDELCQSDKPYRCTVHGWYDKNSPDDMPLMYWASRSVIWEHYGFTDQRMPATQSSVQYIRKGDFSANLFLKMQENYANRIPTEKLKNKWGGGQPDELYLNITLAQLNYSPDLPGVIWFGDNNSITFSKVKQDYQILSMFGTSRNIQKQFTDGYDNHLANISRGTFYKPTPWKYIAPQKIANQQKKPQGPVEGLGRGAFTKRFFAPAKLTGSAINGTVNLFTSFYSPKDPTRAKELETVMHKNIANPLITRIYNLGTPYNHDKVVNFDYTRPTYQDFINEANKAAGDYSIIANSDIFFDNSLCWIDQVSMEGNMIALCRYNIQPKGNAKLFAYAHSQDCWIFKGPISITGCEYMTGKPGCDNKFAYDCAAQGYGVYNPALDIKSYHLHLSPERNYSEADRLPPPYKPVYISSINDIKRAAVKRMLLIQPGKVGDIIICAPIAKHYAIQGYKIDWLAPAQYHDMLACLGYVNPVTNRKGIYEKTIDLSFGINPASPVHREWLKRKKQGQSFVELKYELAGVPLKNLRNLTYIRDEQKENELFQLLGLDQSKPFELVHGSSDYGSPVDPDCANPVKFTPIPGFTIFDWRGVIENASEIHCIDSSLVNFVDRLTVKAKLFYYITDKVPTKADQTILNNNWTVINCLEYAHS